MNRIHNRRRHESIVDGPSIAIHHASALCASVVNQFREVARLVGFRQWSDANAGFPRHSALELIYSGTEMSDEGIDDFPLNKQHFESRASLPVVRERAQNAFLYSLSQIRVL